MSNETEREHLFISYASEDRALAEWLALKLTAEGYRVWCDRFQLLGGESYPRDIDEAIKNRTFRLIALLSKYSISKQNPLKERTLALNIAKERGIDFVIPLNLDNLKPTELDWMTSDLTFISFYRSWAEGLNQLLKKLTAINAPQSLENGKRIAAATFLPSSVTTQTPEILFGNYLRFEKIPDIVKRYTFSRGLSDDEYAEFSKRWAFYTIDPLTILTFHSPPDGLSNQLNVSPAGGSSWRYVDQISRIPTRNIVSALLRRSMYVKCFSKGLELALGHRAYFPQGLLQNDRIYFRGYDGKKTWIAVVGERTFWSPGKPSQGYRYHLSPEFRVRRDLRDPFLLFLRITLYITDADGQPLERRSALSRRKRVCRDWWNNEWLKRHLAVYHFLADGEKTITIGQSEDEQIILSAEPPKYEAPFGIDEESLGPPRLPEGNDEGEGHLDA